MKSYNLPGLEREDNVTFPGIPSGKVSEKRSELDRKLRKKMRKNEIRESQSIRFASGFVSTPPLDDE